MVCNVSVKKRKKAFSVCDLQCASHSWQAYPEAPYQLRCSPSCPSCRSVPGGVPNTVSCVAMKRESHSLVSKSKTVDYCWLLWSTGCCLKRLISYWVAGCDKWRCTLTHAHSKCCCCCCCCRFWWQAMSSNGHCQNTARKTVWRNSECLLTAVMEARSKWGDARVVVVASQVAPFALGTALQEGACLTLTLPACWLPLARSLVERTLTARTVSADCTVAVQTVWQRGCIRADRQLFTAAVLPCCVGHSLPFPCWMLRYPCEHSHSCGIFLFSLCHQNLGTC